MVRDSEGDIIAAAAIPLLEVSGPEHSEIQAILHAFEFAGELDLAAFVIESDCLLLVKAINSPAQDMSYLADFVNLAKMKCQSRSCLGLQYVSRKCNIPAHLLAVFSYSLKEPSY